MKHLNDPASAIKMTDIIRLVLLCIVCHLSSSISGQNLIDDSFTIQDLLNDGYRVQCKITDEEMAPIYQMGDDIIVASIDDRNKLKKKDVVLVNINNRYVCRRILKIKNGVISLKGDSQKKKDIVECDTSKIIAIVQTKELPRRPKSLDTSVIPKRNATVVPSKNYTLVDYYRQYWFCDADKDYIYIDTTDSIADISNYRDLTSEDDYYLRCRDHNYSIDRLAKNIAFEMNLDSRTALIRAKKMIEKWYSIGAIQLNNDITVGSFAEGLEEMIWEEVREKRPYNFQSELYHKFDDGSAIFIITEPTEEATLEDIENVFSGLDYKVFTHKKELGYDGWLKDAVVCVNNFDDSQKDVIKDKLFTMLYGTTYKAELTPIYSLPAIRPFNEDLKLNLQVSAAELKAWIFDNKESFKDDKGNINTLDFWVDGSKNQDVLQSVEPGFVVWIVNKENDNETFKINARKFALDIDLILGAIERNGKVAIIGRQRSVSTTTLPPMRPETIMMLASTKENQLEQSFERNHIFAGKLPNYKDWAPILLSDELWHTEYGYLLNITDQMIKSWSENGSIDDENFNCTKPINYPFFDGAFREFDASELTYNWNTAGAGYEQSSTDKFPYNIYALNRTGSLPVSYIPGEGGDVEINDLVFLAEETAYDYFSSLCNPELIKVVQYAAIYQIFMNYGVHINDYNPSINRLRKDTHNTKVSLINIDNLKKDLQRILIELYQEGELDNYFSSYETQSLEKLKHLRNTIAYNLIHFKNNENVFWDKLSDCIVNPRENLLYNYEECTKLKKELMENIKKINDWLKDIIITQSIRQIKVAHLKSNPLQYSEANKRVKELEEEEEKYINQARAKIDEYQKILAELPDENQLTIGNVASECISCKSHLIDYATQKEIVDIEDVMQEYVAQNTNSFSCWIKCPTIALSYINSYERFLMTGGHNIVSKITPVQIDNTLKAGQFKVVTVNGQKSIMVAASDAKNVTPDLLRQVERTKLSGLQKFGKESQIVRSRDKVIPVDAFKSSAKADIKRFDISRNRLSEIDEMLHEIKTSVSTGNKGTQQFEIRGLSESEIEATLADIRGLQIEVISESDALARVTIPAEPRVVGVKKYAIDRAKITEIDDMLRDINVSMSKSPETSKQFIIEGLTENEVRIIFEDGSSCIADKGATMNLNMELFDFDNIMVESLSGSETTTRVTIPVQAKSIGMKKASMVYDVPTEKVNTFIKTLKEIFPKMKERWNNFPFMRQLKKNNINEDEIREIFMYETAKIIHQLKQEFYVEYFSEEAA